VEKRRRRMRNRGEEEIIMFQTKKLAENTCKKCWALQM
jgi:hypothetical protein